MSKPVVVIDPGHGGKDPGAVAGGIKEKDVNIYIASVMKGMFHLVSTGVDVLLTRQNDEYVTLVNRVGQAKSSSALLFISVHCNAGGGTGFETYTGEAKSVMSSTIQSEVHRRISDVLRKYGIRDRGMKKGDFYVINRFVPSILIEFGFLDNYKDMMYLANACAIAEMCQAIAMACIDTLFGYKRNDNR